MSANGPEANVEEPDIWVRLAKDNLAAWMLNWMTTTALEVMGTNIIGAASTVNKELNTAKFHILPDRLQDVPDVTKYTLAHYESISLQYTALFNPEALRKLVEYLIMRLGLLYATGKVLQGSVRGLLHRHDVDGNVLLDIYYIYRKED